MSDQIEADDVIGKRIYNPDNGQGLGVALKRKTISNLKGDTRDVFVCALEPGNTTNRDVDDVLDYLNNDAWGDYQLMEDPWKDER